MVIVQLKGGLGNQLFQYAAGLHLGLYHQVETKVDTTLLNIPDEEINTIRSFDLLAIQKPPSIASLVEIKKAQGSFFSQKIEKILPSFKRNIYNEKSFEFDTNFLKAKKNTYLKGYRQSEKYFSSIKNIVLQNFKIKEEITKSVSDFSIQLQQENSISIHLRRGDYTNTSLINYHGIIDVTYYKEAIEIIQSKYPDCKFYIFSDNIEWAKQNLNIENSTYITTSISQSSITDFHLMQSCKHNIIANSTFSWWAAYLNSNPNKIVIAPKRWFNQVDYNTKDLFPESWITI